MTILFHASFVFTRRRVRTNVNISKVASNINVNITICSWSNKRKGFLFTSIIKKESPQNSSLVLLFHNLYCLGIERIHYGGEREIEMRLTFGIIRDGQMVVIIGVGRSIEILI